MGTGKFGFVAGHRRADTRERGPSQRAADAELGLGGDLGDAPDLSGGAAAHGVHLRGECAAPADDGFLHAIRDEGFRIPRASKAQSVSFSETSALALGYACDGRLEASPEECVIAMRFRADNQSRSEPSPSVCTSNGSFPRLMRIGDRSLDPAAETSWQSPSFSVSCYLKRWSLPWKTGRCGGRATSIAPPQPEPG